MSNITNSSFSFSYIKELITANINLDSVSNFTQTQGQRVLDLYNYDLPPSSPKNMALLVAAPLAGVAAASIVLRTGAGVLAIGTKALGVVANLANETTKVIDKSMEKSGDKLGEFATRDTSAEIKLTALLTGAVLAGIGVHILMNRAALPVPPIPDVDIRVTNPPIPNIDPAWYEKFYSNLPSFSK